MQQGTLLLLLDGIVKIIQLVKRVAGLFKTAGVTAGVTTVLATLGLVRWILKVQSTL